MAAPKTTKVDRFGQPDGFDVVVRRSIGRVEFSHTGDRSPGEAAMMLIGRDLDPGEYEFPGADGGVVHVIIEVDPPEDYDGSAGQRPS